MVRSKWVESPSWVNYLFNHRHNAPAVKMITDVYHPLPTLPPHRARHNKCSTFTHYHNSVFSATVSLPSVSVSQVVLQEACIIQRNFPEVALLLCAAPSATSRRRKGNLRRGETWMRLGPKIIPLPSRHPSSLYRMRGQPR